jgi:HD-like signal output (HDOD) protein
MLAFKVNTRETKRTLLKDNIRASVMATHKDLIQRVEQQLQDDSLQLPGLPDIAWQVQQAVADPNMTLPKLATLISKDAALSARLVKIANSAWLGRPVKAENLPQAVMRLGFWQIRNVALGMALEGLYESTSEVVKDELAATWQQSIQLTAAAVTLLNHSPHAQAKALHSHTLALACISSRIGVLPLLTEIERNPSTFDDMEAFRVAKRDLTTPLGVNILEAWHFNAEIVRLQKEWRRGIGAMTPSYLSFMQLAGILTEQLQVAQSDEVLKMYADVGTIPRAGIWQQPAVQADYENILSALRD